MKRTMSTAIALVMFTLGATALVVGCATSGLERREAVVSSMEETRDYIARARAQTAATMTALNAMPGKNGDALTAQYRLFSREFEQLQSLANDLGSQAAKVRERSNEQLRAWQEETRTLQDPELRQRAEARRAELAARYNAFAAQVAETQQTLYAFLTDLRDIRRYLEADLTPQGIAAVQDKIAAANRHMTPVMQSLAQLNERLTILAERVSPGGAPPPIGTAGASPAGSGSGSSTTGGSGSTSGTGPEGGASTPSQK